MLWGLAFGLESAVVSFNRFPMLGIAIARRTALSMAAAYFDDELAVELVRDTDCSQVGLRLVFRLMGAPPQPEKGFTPTANRTYLGSSIHTGEFELAGFVRVQPKAATVTKVLQKVDTILQAGQLSRDEAGKLRGDVMWLFTMAMGHLGKLVGPTLTRYQQSNTPELDEPAKQQLLVLRCAVLNARPRDVPVLPLRSPCLRVYTDASFEAGVLRLGWVLFPPGRTPVGGTCVVPASFIATWQPRTQQIYPGETLATLVVPALHSDYFRDQDVLWFIDNEASAAAIIRATSDEPDVLILVQQSHLQFQGLRCRPWIEWVDSESNPSDGLSRLGLSDEWTRRQPWEIFEHQFPALLDPDSFLASLRALT